MAYAAYLRVYEPVSAIRTCIRAAIDGAARDEREIAVARYVRARSRWRAFAAFEQAN